MIDLEPDFHRALIAQAVAGRNVSHRNSVPDRKDQAAQTLAARIASQQRDRCGPRNVGEGADDDNCSVDQATVRQTFTIDHACMSDEFDGGLPPGGAPEQQPCDCGPCPWCEEERGMSSPCTLALGHSGDHQCAYGDPWEQAGAGAAPQRKYCGGKCEVPACGKSCTRQFLHVPPHMCPLGHTW